MATRSLARAPNHLLPNLLWSTFIQSGSYNLLSTLFLFGVLPSHGGRQRGIGDEFLAKFTTTECLCRCVSTVVDSRNVRTGTKRFS
jgi:hypothetical protein